RRSPQASIQQLCSVLPYGVKKYTCRICCQELPHKETDHKETNHHIATIASSCFFSHVHQ
ncbi:MAG TPA: hypothetical protein P5030_07740, partial [Rectinema sp.]|nr:hypothetical protein [Rectinema sp.]HRU03977.1 hypothetical protein [Rectinema sp.]